jgi:hypothetical protein
MMNCHYFIVSSTEIFDLGFISLYHDIENKLGDPIMLVRAAVFFEFVFLFILVQLT